MTETRTLSAMEHTIRLGSWEQSLKYVFTVRLDIPLSQCPPESFGAR